jgi:predicted dehydrogenase
VKNVLIVGLGIGKVYEEQCELLGFTVFTLDTDITKNPTYTSEEQVKGKSFDLSIICVPNYLHEHFIHLLAPISEYLLIEKPGVSDVELWEALQDLYVNTRFAMVKNNYFRPMLLDITKIFYYNLSRLKKMRLIWKSVNRVPFPGFWFTNKEKAFGGVSYDIIPHLLSMLFKIVQPEGLLPIASYKEQRWSIEDITSTDYGVINKTNPVYDVDDYCYLEYKCKGVQIQVEAAWKDDNINEDIQQIILEFEDESLVYNFGLCPNYVYGLMLRSLFNGDNFSYKWIDAKIIDTISKIKEK